MIWEINMNIIEMLNNVQFLVDSKGNKKSVMLEYRLWEKLLEAINAAHSELPDKEERALQKKIRDKQHELVQNEW
jgi:hypothetical protein